MADVNKVTKAAGLTGSGEADFDACGSGAASAPKDIKTVGMEGERGLNIGAALDPMDGIREQDKDADADEPADKRRRTSLAEGVKWNGPAPLIYDNGADWDFQDNGITESLKASVPDHFAQWKANNKSKRAHPLFVVLGPSGTSKSRTLQEIPVLLKGMFKMQEIPALLLKGIGEEMFEELHEKLQNPHVVNITLEKGNSDLVTNPCDPSREFGVRLMRQLGVESPSPQPTLEEAFEELARAVGRPLGEMTIILTVDGMQGLPGDWKDADSAFHRGMLVVVDLVCGSCEAFVICAVSCSTMAPGEVRQLFAASGQRHEIITSRPLSPPKRCSIPVFGDDLQLLVHDMGGLGAALTSLERAWDLWQRARESGTGVGLSDLFKSVLARLIEKYPQSARVPNDVIGASLAGIWIDPKTDFKGHGKPAHCCMCNLVTLEYNRDKTQVRFVVPYVLLAMKGFLSHNFDD